MRVTERMRWVRTQRQLEQTTMRGDQAAQQALSGKRVSKSSDDIAAHDASNRLQEHGARQRAFHDNASKAHMELERMDQTLSLGHDLLARARELSVQFGDASYSSDEMSVASEEVKGLKEALVRIANTEHMGRPLFGGTGSGKVVDADGNYLQPSPTAREITIGESNSKLSMATGPQAFGGPGQSAFEALDSFVAALQGGDSTAVRSAQVELDTALDTLQDAQQRVGQNMTRAQEAMQFAEQMQQLNTMQSDKLTESDFVETISAMQQSSTIYELSLKIASEQKQLSRSILSL